MPPALVLSPEILDHSFPRSAAVLKAVGICLGVVQGDAEAGKYRVLITQATEQFACNFEWAGVQSYPDLQIIYYLIVQWLLQPSEAIIIVNTSDASTFVPHPVPHGAGYGEAVSMWQDETGKLYEMANRCQGGAGFAGVCCVRAFSGGVLGQYEPPVPQQHFPLVGPTQVGKLSDCEEWVIPAYLNSMLASYQSVRKNLYLLQGKVSDVPVGSHYKVTFPGAPRSWTLDSNLEVIPDRFLSQIASLTNLPLDVIRHVLILGSFPEKRCRIY